MFQGKDKDYFDGPGSKPAPVQAEKKPAMNDQDGDEAKPVATITVHKKPEGGMSFKHDAGDGMPADEAGSVADLAKMLEEKYGEDNVEDAEEKVAPGVHEKAGDYLSKAMKA